MVSINLPLPRRVATRSQNPIEDGKYNVGTYSEEIIVLTDWNN